MEANGREIVFHNRFPLLTADKKTLYNFKLINFCFL